MKKNKQIRMLADESHIKTLEINSLREQNHRLERLTAELTLRQAAALAVIKSQSLTLIYEEEVEYQRSGGIPQQTSNDPSEVESRERNG